MDYKTLNLRLAAALGQEPQVVASLADAFAKVLSDSVDTLTTVAIPSFGSFCPVKYDEEIKTDLTTGKRMIFPPQIVIEFHPAASLRKKMKSHE